MSKKSNGRLRVFFAEFEGDDATIQQGLHAISVAVSKTFQPQRIVQYVPTEAQNGETIVEQLEVESHADPQNLIDAPARPRSKRKRKCPVMNLVKELNLRPDRKPHLHEFYEEKNPRTQFEQICVFLYYLRRVLEIPNVTAHHVFTCFKDVGIKVPNDLPQVIRNTAKKKGWVEASDSSALEITSRGENLIEHDLTANNG